MPMRTMGVGCSSPSTSATAPPMPPIMLCSSAVTTAPHRWAYRTTVSTSRGLTVCRLTTAAAMPCSASRSATSRAMYHVAAGKDSQVPAVPEHRGLAGPELIVRAVDYRHPCPAQAQVNGALVGCRPAGHCFGLRPVGRDQHRHVGQSPHQGDVFKHLMGGAVFSPTVMPAWLAAILTLRLG